MANHSGAVMFLFFLLAGFPVIAALPGQVAVIRLAGLSLLWWYGGVIAPVLACVVAMVGLSGAPSPRRPE